MAGHGRLAQQPFSGSVRVGARAAVAALPSVNKARMQYPATSGVIVTLLCLCPHAAAGAGSQDDAGRWLAGDMHNHSFLTDGNWPPRQVIEKGLSSFGLDWIVNSEHGGAYTRNPLGLCWDDPGVEPATLFRGDVRMGQDNHRLMWRWQSLYECSYPLVEQARHDPRFAGKPIMQGVEFNAPGHAHASVGILAGTGLPIAEFEYRFDEKDSDTSGGVDGMWEGKNPVNNHAKTMQAIEWLRQNHGNRSWFIVNHPERGNGYTIADLCEFNDAAPEIAFGFEGAPGHQHDPNRGEYTEESYHYADNDMGGATYGGAGVFLARVGGVWDAMLAQGRRYFVFANSDFHDDRRDFFPGQYQKTYVKVTGPATEQAILDAMRAGRSFFTAGDLIDSLDLDATTTDAGATATVGIGEQLDVASGTGVVVKIRLHDPSDANCLGDKVAVNHFDLIGGDITGPFPRTATASRTPSSNPASDVELNPTARVLARFDKTNWMREGKGWISATFTLTSMHRNMYLRLRGTNLAPNTPRQTDAEGNPLSDAPDQRLNADGIAEARSDLWFYSNPLFIHVR
jgi:hypothetical protein